MVDGLHVPTIPFGDVVSKLGTVIPSHNVKAVAKSGVMVFVIVTANVIGDAH